jgi:hypothetical protein
MDPWTRIRTKISWIRNNATNCCFLHRFYLAVAAGVAGLAGARVVVDPVHAGRLVQARALRTLVNVVLAIRP